MAAGYSLRDHIIGPGDLDTVMGLTKDYIESFDDGTYTLDDIIMEPLGDDWFRGIVRMRGVEIVSNGDCETIRPSAFSHDALGRCTDAYIVPVGFSAHNGSKVMELTCTTVGAMYWRFRQNVPIAPYLGARLLVRGYCYVPSTAPRSYSVVRLFYDFYGTNLTEDHLTYNMNVGNRDVWLPFILEIDVPSDANELEFMFHAGSAPAQIGDKIYWDDFSIKYS